jgi:hypothetical protein
MAGAWGNGKASTGHDRRSLIDYYLPGSKGISMLKSARHWGHAQASETTLTTTDIQVLLTVPKLLVVSQGQMNFCLLIAEY